MQDKFEYFNQLPNVIKGEVTKFLPTKEFINLSMTSKSNHNLFRTNQYLAPLQEARKFLHHVVRGNHEAVANMLEINPSLKLPAYLMWHLNAIRMMSFITAPRV